MNYPDSWLCSKCNKSYAEHIKIGQRDGMSLATHEWCFGNDINDGVKQGWFFTPMDNLSLIEQEAKHKGL